MRRARRNSLTLVIALAAVALVAPDLRAAEDDVERSGQELITPETQLAINQGLAFIASRQDRVDGAIPTYGKEVGDRTFGALGGPRRRVAVTALCGMAFLSSGSTPGRGKYGAQTQRCVEFLISRCQPNGFIFEEGTVDHGPMYDHGFATLFLAEAYGMSKKDELRPCLQRAVKLIVSAQNKEGGWRYEPNSKDADLSVTICQVMALRAARNSGIHVPKETIDRCTEYVRKSQTPEGGFRYQLGPNWSVTPGLTAAGVVALYSAGIYEGKEIESGLAHLERFRPGQGTRQGANHYFYTQYYAVQAMWHAGGKRWRDWYPEIRDELVHAPFRTAAGSWRDSWGEEYGTAMALLILQTPNNYLPIFQR